MNFVKERKASFLKAMVLLSKELLYSQISEASIQVAFPVVVPEESLMLAMEVAKNRLKTVTNRLYSAS